MTVQRQIDRLIDVRAGEWFEAIRCGETHRHREFLDWLAESSRHLEAFLAIAASYPAVQNALRSGHFDVNALLRNGTPRVTDMSPALPARRFAATNRKWTLAAAAAALAVVAIGVGVAMLRNPQFETPTGEQRIIHLTDGSVVNLNARSHLRVRMDATRRELYLLQGEALFKVARDAARPFRVYTRGAMVQAIGTQFNVYAHKDGTTRVSVVEGKVQVAPAQTAAAALPLKAGEQADVAATGRIARVAAPDVQTATAWQQRKLVFKHTGLETIVEEFNRYNTLRLRLEGIDSGAFRFSGIFDADDPQSLASLLQQEPELVIERREREIVIRRR